MLYFDDGFIISYVLYPPGWRWHDVCIV